jgi:hypothetical protein
MVERATGAAVAPPESCSAVSALILTDWKDIDFSWIFLAYGYQARIIPK